MSPTDIVVARVSETEIPAAQCSGKVEGAIIPAAKVGRRCSATSICITVISIGEVERAEVSAPH